VDIFGLKFLLNMLNLLINNFHFKLISIFKMCLSLYQVNVVDGLKLFEELVDDSEVPKLVSLVNDLRAAGKRGQFQGKFTKCILFHRNFRR
jgi:hypothetical protein